MARRRVSTNLHKSNERCQFKLYIGYWTSNNNKWPKCYQTPSPVNTCANDNDVTENDVIDSWMNMHTLLASRPRRRALTRVDVRGLNGPLPRLSQGCTQGRPKCAKNVLKWRTFELMG